MIGYGINKNATSASKPTPYEIIAKEKVET